jgi:hypothetical protein
MLGQQTKHTQMLSNHSTLTFHDYALISMDTKQHESSYSYGEVAYGMQQTLFSIPPLMAPVLLKCLSFPHYSSIINNKLGSHLALSEDTTPAS